MKRIKLTKGKHALVEDEDYLWLSQWKWLCGGRGYAARNTHFRNEDGTRHTKVVWMHREIMQTPTGLLTDHINGNKLDNRRSNLRVVTSQQNNWNTRIPSHNSTGFKGVYRRKNRWEAAIHLNNRKIHLGRFRLIEEAISAYNKAAKNYFGDYANLNTL